MGQWYRGTVMSTVETRRGNRSGMFMTTSGRFGNKEGMGGVDKMKEKRRTGSEWEFVSGSRLRLSFGSDSNRYPSDSPSKSSLSSSSTCNEVRMEGGWYYLGSRYDRQGSAYINRGCNGEVRINL